MKALVNKKYLLQKYEGKGGWTYVVIPEITKDKREFRGQMRVKGSIDGYAINKYHLMPMGNGALFLPVKAEIRKHISKQAGDKVHVTLYHDTDPLEIPGEFLLCLEDEPKALQYFNSLTESEQKYYVQWVYAAKKDETKTTRLAKAIDRLAQGVKFYAIG